MNLYYNKKEEIYLTNDNNIICSFCNNIIEESFIYLNIFSQTYKQTKHICKKCSKKHKNIGVVEAFHLVFIVSEIPIGSIPIFKFKPQLSETRTGTTVFNEAEKRNCRIINNTKYSGRDESIFLDIEENKQITVNRIKELDNKPDNNFFNNLRNSNIIK